MTNCEKAPKGWYCTRGGLHPGPCAARRVSTQWSRFVHNVIAHPLLVLFPPIGERLHDRNEP